MVVSYKGDGNTEDQEKKKTQSIHHCYYAVFLTKNRKYKKYTDHASREICRQEGVSMLVLT